VLTLQNSLRKFAAFVSLIAKHSSFLLSINTLLYLLYTTEIVGVCMFTYISRADKPICAKLDMLIHWGKKDNMETSKLQNKMS
jgi:hypothetical protein